MGLKKRIETESPIRTIVVPYDGDAYVVVGRPDAVVVNEVVLMPQGEAMLKAAHWKNVTGRDFDVATVGRVIAIARTLHRTEDDRHELSDPEDAKPLEVAFDHGGAVQTARYWPSKYDETEVAALSHEDPVLYLLLAKAAYTVLGLNGKDAFDEVASGNSEKPVRSKSK